MEPIQEIKSRTAVLAVNDVDTDQIIPARFLTTTSRAGLGENLFHDWRFQSDGSLKGDFVLNCPASDGCQILVAGNNFGCGSSREHAPWALLDFGFRAVISTEIADIFRSNSLKNGLLPLVVDQETHDWLMKNPGVELRVDLRTSTLTLPNGRTVPFPIDTFARYCLLQGIDQLGFIQNSAGKIRLFEDSRSWTP
jgi:3-isopropylmalate/(R)-2-methylmalate dehydratase small subunit